MAKRQQAESQSRAFAARGEPRSEKVMLRLRPDELDTVDAMAEKLDMTRSDTIRHALGELAKKTPGI